VRCDQVETRITDEQPGWRVGDRVLPRAYTVSLKKYVRGPSDARSNREFWSQARELTDAEREVWARDEAAFERDEDCVISLKLWLELDIETAEDQPPRCVALRAPDGIGTPEQRIPLVGIVTEASASIANRNESFKLGELDFPGLIEFEDVKWELGRARGHKRVRREITRERLEEIVQVARRYPRTPTAAVQYRFGYSRGHARRLIKQAEQAGLL
jgi:hypothetical protein